MGKISYADFGRLRLSSFFPVGTEIAPLEDWEFMDCSWVGEAIGFTEFLRLWNDPKVTRSISIDFTEIPASAAEAILIELALPLRSGMNSTEVSANLDAEVCSTSVFDPRRFTHDFVWGSDDPFEISCTFEDTVGLVYLVIMRPDYLTVTQDPS